MGGIYQPIIVQRRRGRVPSRWRPMCMFMSSGASQAGVNCAFAIRGGSAGCGRLIRCPPCTPRVGGVGRGCLAHQARAVAPAVAANEPSIKAALLDQHVVAGLGNIYVDELLFACGLSPARPADTLTREQVRTLVRRMRTLLRRAIEAGGSTFRDYVDGMGGKGEFQQQHRVYGRGGEPCQRCRAVLTTIQVAGRTTVFCPQCQPQ